MFKSCKRNYTEESNCVRFKEVTAEMTPLMFKDAFWGSEFTCHAGYDAVIQRLRDGRQMCKDVEELLKMRAMAEEKYGKELVTIAHKAGGHTEISTLRASFEQLQAQIENMGHIHIELSELLKDEVKKIEIFRERQKEQRKTFQSIMEKVQKKKVSLYKKTMEAKKNYELRCREADEAEKLSITSKNPEKVRHKAKHYRQTAIEAEKLYLNNVVQLESVRQDWEETHRSTCEVFQQLEGDRISMLRCALWDHCNHLSMQCVKDDEFYEEVRKKLEQCDITTDNNCFVQTKATGSRPPEPIMFESFHAAETSGNGFMGGGDNMIRRSHRYSDPVLASSVNMNLDSLRNSTSALTSIDESSADISGEGHASLPDLQNAASLATVSADEDTYIVLYEYTAQADDELSVRRGDLLRVLEREEDGWWSVDRNGMTGLVPGNFLGKL